MEEAKARGLERDVRARARNIARQGGRALSRAGERLLAERRRLPVRARLTLSVGDRAIPLGQGRLTLTA
jgi:hypothetical protein